MIRIMQFRDTTCKERLPFKVNTHILCVTRKTIYIVYHKGYNLHRQKIIVFQTSKHDATKQSSLNIQGCQHSKTTLYCFLFLFLFLKFIMITILDKPDYNNKRKSRKLTNTGIISSHYCSALKCIALQTFTDIVE